MNAKKILFGAAIVTVAALSVYSQTALPEGIESASPEATIESIRKWDAALWNAPFSVLIAIALTALSGLLAYVHWCPNKIIPAVLIVSAIGGLFLQERAGGLTLSLWIGKNLFMGLIVGIAAWGAGLKWVFPIIAKIAGKQAPEVPPTPPAESP